MKKFVDGIRKVVKYVKYVSAVMDCLKYIAWRFEQLDLEKDGKQDFANYDKSGQEQA